MFTILCEVSGGVTGYRQGYLRNGEGGLATFTTEAKAQTEAYRLTNEHMSNRYRTADYQYTVQQH